MNCSSTDLSKWVRRPAASTPTSVTSASPIINAEAVVAVRAGLRSEEHTSELQSRLHLVCRLLLEKKKNIHTPITPGCNTPIRPAWRSHGVPLYGTTTGCATYGCCASRYPYEGASWACSTRYARQA